MTVTYFKRYRMEFDLRELPLVRSNLLPANYYFAPWHDKLTRDHADVKWQSFRFELDANVFPCLGDRDGCLKLMRDISGRHNFIPAATWLVLYRDPDTNQEEPCATIQGLRTDAGLGSIQNIGVLAPHRGNGLGSALLMQSLHGFRSAGCQRVQLEVTVQNKGAVRLYERLGFRRVETLFKVAEIVTA
jgi:GNAT superfamily N-acetyltransferase